MIMYGMVWICEVKKPDDNNDDLLFYASFKYSYRNNESVIMKGSVQ